MKPAFRQTIRVAVLVLAVLVTLPQFGAIQSQILTPSFSPFLVVCSTIATRALTMFSLMAIPVLVLSALFHRPFCRYACPTGLLQEIFEKISPFSKEYARRSPQWGVIIVAFTLGGAFLGMPLLIWMDPLAIFNAFVSAWRQPLTIPVLLSGSLLPILLVFDFLFPRVWCRKICPLGATQDLLTLAKSRCRKTPCENFDRCPNETLSDDKSDLLKFRGRRLVLGTIIGLIGAQVKCLTNGRAKPPIRPPGSLSEKQFASVCVRCGNCAQACPSKIIYPDLDALNPTELLTPRLSFEHDYCRSNCNRCNLVCPSGAIQKLDLKEKQRSRIGYAIVDAEICLMIQGRECTSCMSSCPFNAIVVKSSDGGFSREPSVLLKQCTGCGACESVCPTRPKRSITVTRNQQTA